jgi:hypothetical protein
MKRVIAASTSACVTVVRRVANSVDGRVLRKRLGKERQANRPQPGKRGPYKKKIAV